jgi:hypothetical protein
MPTQYTDDRPVVPPQGAFGWTQVASTQSNVPWVAT